MNDEIPFVKMHGLGNSYIYINSYTTNIDNPNELSRKMSDKQFGIGSDGLILIGPSLKADVSMRMFNADGSESEMCGNGIRCLSRYARDFELVQDDNFVVDTLAGLKSVVIHRNPQQEISSVTVNMGTYSTSPEVFPIQGDSLPDQLIDIPIEIDNYLFHITCVDVGNPHCIIHTDHITDELVLQYGPKLENHPIFPERTNVEFIKVLDSSNIQMRVWERGSGETAACGTGAVASVVSSILHGFTGNNVVVHLNGGDLTISFNPETRELLMTGPAEYICRGLWYE